MTKKDYELIAEIIKKWKEDGGALNLVSIAFANRLEKENPRFDRQRFLEACGLESNSYSVKDDNGNNIEFESVAPDAK